MLLTFSILSAIGYLVAIPLSITDWSKGDGFLRLLHRGIFICAVGFPILLLGGFLLSIAGDALFKGSGEQFDWGFHAFPLLIVMGVGGSLAPISVVLELVAGARWLYLINQSRRA